MAMSFMIRKASSRAVVPLAVRALTTSRPSFYDCFSTVVYPSEIQFIEKKLHKTLESRLKVAKESLRLMPPKPANFPFMIEYDQASGNSITLKREIGNEKIEIVASMPYSWKNNAASDDNDLKKRSDEPWILSVKVLKENGNALLFGVRASEMGYEIDSMIVDKAGSEKTYKDPIWVDTLTSGVQEDLRKYLDIRGLKEIDYEFLDNYLQECIEREKFILLSEVEQFLKGSKDIDATQVIPRPTPANFPFRIEYSPDTWHDIILKREIGSQKIEIVASMQYEGMNGSDEPCPAWRLTVKVSRENGSALMIRLNAFEKGYEIEEINGIPVGTTVQEALRKYLDIIGLKEIDFEFLKNKWQHKWQRHLQCFNY